MKIYKYFCLITLSLLFTNSMFAQFDELDMTSLKVVNDEFLIDKNLYSFYPKNPGTGEDFNFYGGNGFGGSNFAALNAGLMLEARKRAALEDWYDVQRKLVKDEIEEYYNHNFNSYTEAVNRTLIDFGKNNHQVFFDFDRNVINLKNRHIKTNKEYVKRNNVNIRELHHLNYRKQEILNGNVNNSIFTFSEIYGGIKLKDIRDINSINRNWDIIKGFLDTNLPTEQNAKYHNDDLGNLDDKFDNFMLSLQRKFYNDELNPGQRLFLEQFSINVLKALRANPNAFRFGSLTNLNLNIPDGLGKGLSVPKGSEDVLQNYLWAYSKRSVFDPNYYLKVLDEILVNNGYQPVYGDLSKLPRTVGYYFTKIAKNQAIERRNNAFNNLINSSTTEDILTDLFITALGERNNAFLDARPTLREEVIKYFKANNRSQYAHDGINYLLNQYQDSNTFPVDASLFQSKNNPLFQDGNNQNRALKIDFKPQAVTEGITGFGNVLAELFKDNAKPGFSGSLIRTIFNSNSLNVNGSVLNDWLGLGFKIASNDGNSIQINFENNNGSILFDFGYILNSYISNLIDDLGSIVTLNNIRRKNLFLLPKNIGLINQYLVNNNNSNEAKLFVDDFLQISEEIKGAKFERFIEMRNLIENNPFALIEDCIRQNGLDISNYRQLYNHRIPQVCQNKLNALGSDFKDQPIETGNAAVANVDYYPVEITKNPDFNSDGIPDSDIEVYEAYRKNFSGWASGEKKNFQFSCNIPLDLDNRGDVSWEFVPYTNSELTLWNSTNPLTTIFKIDANANIFGGDAISDDGAIMISAFNPNYWIGSTIATFWSGTQPFSGNRQWGFLRNQNGRLELYARAVDVARVSAVIKYGPGNDECKADTYYNIGEATWTNLQNQIAKWVNFNGGEAVVKTKTAIRFDKTKIKEILESNDRIDQIKCD